MHTSSSAWNSNLSAIPLVMNVFPTGDFSSNPSPNCRKSLIAPLMAKLYCARSRASDERPCGCSRDFLSQLTPGTNYIHNYALLSLSLSLSFSRKPRAIAYKNWWRKLYVARQIHYPWNESIAEGRVYKFIYYFCFLLFEQNIYFSI